MSIFYHEFVPKLFNYSRNSHCRTHLHIYGKNHDNLLGGYH